MKKLLVIAPILLVMGCSTQERIYITIPTGTSDPAKALRVAIRECAKYNRKPAQPETAAKNIILYKCVE
ncbi:hypothetical protein ACQU0X_12015 [Pseudovibrio ascidiaceicola]|uniref:hypothetical protein n=1 Tax=Pseudovibrio ascidiaceicola TaxID=285279 RepID=UPI003D3641DA